MTGIISSFVLMITTYFLIYPAIAASIGQYDSGALRSEISTSSSFQVEENTNGMQLNESVEKEKHSEDLSQMSLEELIEKGYITQEAIERILNGEEVIDYNMKETTGSGITIISKQKEILEWKEVIRELQKEISFDPTILNSLREKGLIGEAVNEKDLLLLLLQSTKKTSFRGSEDTQTNGVLDSYIEEVILNETISSKSKPIDQLEYRLNNYYLKTEFVFNIPQNTLSDTQKQLEYLIPEKLNLKVGTSGEIKEKLFEKEIGTYEVTVDKQSGRKKVLLKFNKLTRLRNRIFSIRKASMTLYFLSGEIGFDSPLQTEVKFSNTGETTNDIFFKIKRESDLSLDVLQSDIKTLDNKKEYIIEIKTMGGTEGRVEFTNILKGEIYSETPNPIRIFKITGEKRERILHNLNVVDASNRIVLSLDKMAPGTGYEIHYTTLVSSSPVNTVEVSTYGYGNIPITRTKKLQEAMFNSEQMLSLSMSENSMSGANGNKIVNIEWVALINRERRDIGGYVLEDIILQESNAKGTLYNLTKGTRKEITIPYMFKEEEKNDSFKLIHTVIFEKNDSINNLQEMERKARTNAVKIKDGKGVVRYKQSIPKLGAKLKVTPAIKARQVGKRSNGEIIWEVHVGKSNETLRNPTITIRTEPEGIHHMTSDHIQDVAAELNLDYSQVDELPLAGGSNFAGFILSGLDDISESGIKFNVVTGIESYFLDEWKNAAISISLDSENIKDKIFANVDVPSKPLVGEFKRLDEEKSDGARDAYWMVEIGERMRSLSDWEILVEIPNNDVEHHYMTKEQVESVEDLFRGRLTNTYNRSYYKGDVPFVFEKIPLSGTNFYKGFKLTALESMIYPGPVFEGNSFNFEVCTSIKSGEIRKGREFQIDVTLTSSEAKSKISIPSNITLSDKLIPETGVLGDFSEWRNRTQADWEVYIGKPNLPLTDWTLRIEIPDQDKAEHYMNQSDIVVAVAAIQRALNLPENSLANKEQRIALDGTISNDMNTNSYAKRYRGFVLKIPGVNIPPLTGKTGGLNFKFSTRFEDTEIDSDKNFSTFIEFYSAETGNQQVRVPFVKPHKRNIPKQSMFANYVRLGEEKEDLVEAIWSVYVGKPSQNFSDWKISIKIEDENNHYITEDQIDKIKKDSDKIRRRTKFSIEKGVSEQDSISNKVKYKEFKLIGLNDISSGNVGVDDGGLKFNFSTWLDSDEIRKGKNFLISVVFESGNPTFTNSIFASTDIKYINSNAVKGEVKRWGRKENGKRDVVWNVSAGQHDFLRDWKWKVELEDAGENHYMTEEQVNEALKNAKAYHASSPNIQIDLLEKIPLRGTSYYKGFILYSNSGQPLPPLGKYHDFPNGPEFEFSTTVKGKEKGSVSARVSLDSIEMKDSRLINGELDKMKLFDRMTGKNNVVHQYYDGANLWNLTGSDRVEEYEKIRTELILPKPLDYTKEYRLEFSVKKQDKLEFESIEIESSRGWKTGEGMITLDLVKRYEEIGMDGNDVDIILERKVEGDFEKYDLIFPGVPPERGKEPKVFLNMRMTNQTPLKQEQGVEYREVTINARLMEERYDGISGIKSKIVDDANQTYRIEKDRNLNPVKKIGKSIPPTNRDNGWLEYRVFVNESGLDLDPKSDYITIKDEFSYISTADSTLEPEIRFDKVPLNDIISSSYRIDKEVLAEGNVRVIHRLEFKVPDGKKIIIPYRCSKIFTNVPDEAILVESRTSAEGKDGRIGSEYFSSLYHKFRNDSVGTIGVTIYAQNYYNHLERYDMVYDLYRYDYGKGEYTFKRELRRGSHEGINLMDNVHGESQNLDFEFGVEYKLVPKRIEPDHIKNFSGPEEIYLYFEDGEPINKGPNYDKKGTYKLQRGQNEKVFLSFAKHVDVTTKMEWVLEKTNMIDNSKTMERAVDVSLIRKAIPVAAGSTSNPRISVINRVELSSQNNWKNTTNSLPLLGKEILSEGGELEPVRYEYSAQSFGKLNGFYTTIYENNALTKTGTITIRNLMPEEVVLATELPNTGGYGKKDLLSVGVLLLLVSGYGYIRKRRNVS